MHMQLSKELAALQLLGDYSRNEILPPRQHLVYQRIDQLIGSSSLLALTLEAGCDKMNDLMNALRMHHQQKLRWDPQTDMVEYLTPFCQIHSVMHAAMLLTVEQRYSSKPAIGKLKQLAIKQADAGQLYRECGLDQHTAGHLLILDGRQVIDRQLCSLNYIFHQEKHPFVKASEKVHTDSSMKN